MIKTYSQKPAEVDQKWYIVDAKGQTLGRLATQIARLLTGKDKPSYSPHINGGDVVVVINAKNIAVSGKKLTDKMYYRHSGYPGGIKEESLAEALEKHPNRVIEHAVAGMLPKNKLQAVMLKNLKVYADDQHPHAPQKPIEWKLEK
ncbi:MAG: 50S ribosomal protein L13 [Candidatus Saccharibacteria bacterium]